MKVCYGFKTKISGIFRSAGRGKVCLRLSCSNNTIPKISLGTRMMIGKGGNNISHVSAADISFITSHFADNKSQQKYSINWGHLVPPNGNIHGASHAPNGPK